LSTQLLSHLFEIIQYQSEFISFLMRVSFKVPLKKAPFDEPVRKDYQKLKVDDLPILEKPTFLDFKKIVADYLQEHGKILKPVARRLTSTPVPKQLCCPKCLAPSKYLYANNGNSGQFKCKVCSFLFNQKNRYDKDVILKCPHCLKSLEKKKERKDFSLYKCTYKSCSYYLNKKKSMTSQEKKLFKKDPQSFKLHYIYRSFSLDFKSLAQDSPIQTKGCLSKIHASPQTLGLILTYYVNYGLSARRTAALMQDVHGLKISYQTILNYTSILQAHLKPFVDHYPYQLSNQFCGDETYIKVKGKWHYLVFFFDAVNKIILSSPISKHRDHVVAIKAIHDVLIKFEEIPEDLNLVVDGNPIYLLAQQYFAQNDFNFDITQVIGLTNEDEVSREYRPLKQIIERLNRTFKGSYRNTYGFGSQEGAVAFTTLFVAFFNFLRPHGALEGKSPVTIPELSQLPNMPARWIRLISMAQNFTLKLQSA